MSRLVLGYALAIVAASSSLSNAQDDEIPKVFMFARDGSMALERMLDEEVGVMKRILENAGYKVDIATASGESMTAGSVEVTPTIRLSDVDIAEYAGVVLPCMAPPIRDEGMSAEVVTLLERAIKAGKPVAAQRASVRDVAAAGGLVGKTYAYAFDVNERVDSATHRDYGEFFRTAEFAGTGVVRDGTISTSAICPHVAQTNQLPDGTQELMQAFIESLKETK